MLTPLDAVRGSIKSKMNQASAQRSTARPSASSRASGLLPPVSAQVLPAHVVWLQQCFDQCQPDSWAAMPSSTAAADQLKCNRHLQLQQPHCLTAQPSHDVQATESGEDDCISAAADHPQQPHHSRRLQIDPSGTQAHARAGSPQHPDLQAGAQSVSPTSSRHGASMLHVREAQAEAMSVGQPGAVVAQQTGLKVQNPCNSASSKAVSAHSREAEQSPPKKRTQGRCPHGTSSVAHPVGTAQSSLGQQLEQYPQGRTIPPLNYSAHSSPPGQPLLKDQTISRSAACLDTFPESAESRSALMDQLWRSYLAEGTIHLDDIRHEIGQLQQA